VCGEKHGWAIVPASPDRAMKRREADDAARCLFRKGWIQCATAAGGWATLCEALAQ